MRVPVHEDNTVYSRSLQVAAHVVFIVSEQMGNLSDLHEIEKQMSCFSETATETC